MCSSLLAIGRVSICDNKQPPSKVVLREMFVSAALFACLGGSFGERTYGQTATLRRFRVAAARPRRVKSGFGSHVSELGRRSRASWSHNFTNKQTAKVTKEQPQTKR